MRHGGGSDLYGDPKNQYTSVNKYRPRNLSRINLKRVQRFRTRDLFQSHAQRVGTSRENVEKGVGMNPYRPRTTPVMKSSNYPRFRQAPVHNDPNEFVHSLRNNFKSDKNAADEVWLQNRRREAEQSRLKRHTERLLGQWSRQLARFDEEAAWRQETIFATNPAMTKLRSGPTHSDLGKKQFWIQDAWSEAIERGDDSEGDDDEEEGLARPRISAKERNAMRSAGAKQLEGGMKYTENRWRMPNDSRPGTANVVPGMTQLPSVADNNANVANGKEGEGGGDSGKLPIRKSLSSPIVPNPRGSTSSRTLATSLGHIRGPARDPISFSPFQPMSMYGNRASGQRTYGDSIDETIQAEKAEGRLHCDLIKLKLARHGIHVKRGNLERALLAPNLELTEKQKQELPNLLFGLPNKPPGEKKEKKKKKGKSKKGKSKSKKKKTKK